MKEKIKFGGQERKTNWGCVIFLGSKSKSTNIFFFYIIFFSVYMILSLEYRPRSKNIKK